MQVTGIAYRHKNQAPMITTEHAMLTLSAGLEGDYRRRPGKRQVTVMSQHQWHQACAQIDSQIEWTIRRANILIDGLSFSADMLGKTLRIGPAELLICAETEPCHKMDRQHQGLRAALTPDWRGGVCCQVTQAGEIRLGDKIEVI